MLISLVIATSMLAVGLLVWRLLQRQEVDDEELKRMFEADDRRAKAARERTARGRQDDQSGS